MPKACPYISPGMFDTKGKAAGNSHKIIAMDQYRKTPRASFLDYDKGTFFITICTRNRKHYFGEIADGEMHYSEIGEFCRSQLENASKFTDRVRIIAYTVMPNHVHIIVRLRDADKAEYDVFQRTPNPSLRANHECERHVPELSKYIASFKGAVTRYARSIAKREFCWHNRYHDHYIRGLKDGDNIYEYIINNVANWDKDCFR